MNTILCPHCGKQIEISQALRHQIEKQSLAEWEAKKKVEIEQAKAVALSESQKKLQEHFEVQMNELHEDAREKDLRIKQLLERLEKNMEEQRQLKREKDEV